MYIDASTVRVGDKSYTRYLLRESFRQGGKVKHRTIANLSKLSEQEIEAMRLAFKHKAQLSTLSAQLDVTVPVQREHKADTSTAVAKTAVDSAGIDLMQVQLRQGQSIGAVWLLAQLARELGIASALGSERAGRLALWQVLARAIEQGSRLSAVRLARVHACAILDLPRFDEDDLYQNLDWLTEQQEFIEKALFTHSRAGTTAPTFGTHSAPDKVTDKAEQRTPEGLFLYDVTSSYLEGSCNELGAFGYNRDGKKGKSQIVIGLLCDGCGVPLAIEVFAGNTQDPKTVKNQIDKLAARFGAKEVTLVGDRGMLKSAQIALLGEKGYSYITAITKPQIEGLLKSGVLQMDLFDDGLTEVSDSVDQVRYVLRRNPVRQSELAASHQSKFERLRALLDKNNQYLVDHKRAKADLALVRSEKKCKALGLQAWVSVTLNERLLSLSEDAQAKAQHTQLDGCYVIKTDVKVQSASKEVVHARYKDLAHVEWAFRTSKTVLEMRPLYVRLASRTRGHALVVMLAYRLIQELAKRWRNLDVTVAEGIAQLTTLCVHELSVKGVENRQVVSCVPIPNEAIQKLFEHAGIKLPQPPIKEVKISTKRKLTSQRK